MMKVNKILILTLLMASFMSIQDARAMDACVWYDRVKNETLLTWKCQRPSANKKWMVWTKCTDDDFSMCTKAKSQCGGSENPHCKNNPDPSKPL